MSAISDFADKMNVHNEHVDKAIAGIEQDIVGLKTVIQQLQDSAGKITAEDQALLDKIEAKAAAIHEKVDALDAMTPPSPPPG